MSTPTYPTVLVTGANSFYAAAIIDYLIKHYPGTKIHAAVRNQQSAAPLEKRYGKSTITVFLVPDITTPTAFLESVRGCSAIFHVASPMVYSITDAKTQLLDPAINGVRSALVAAASAPTVKRVVLTSSVGAVLDATYPGGYLRPGYRYTEADHFDISYEEACKFTMFGQAYGASKSLAERGAWDFMAEEPRHFDLAVINPVHTMGPYGQHVSGPDNINFTNLTISQLMDGVFTEVPGTPMPWAVGIEEVAQAHVKALYVPEAGGKRFIVANAPFDTQEVVDVMYERFEGEEWLSNVPRGKPGTFKPRDSHFAFDNTRSREVLGVVYGSWKDGVVGFCKQYAEDKKKWASA